MKLPPVKPLEENVICKTKEDFGKLILRTIEESGGGAFFKVLGKSSDGAYYATFLIDDEKILAVEVRDASEGTILVGRAAMEFLKEILESGPVIVDAFPLDDVDVKMSVVENMEVYKSTPKLHLSELCPAFGRVFESTKELADDISASYANEIAESLKKLREKRRTKFIIDAPDHLEPYFRAFGNRLLKYTKTLGINSSEIKISAKEVRYALGAGTGIHAVIEVKGSLNSPIPAPKLKQPIENFVYKEASELSKELGKKVVIKEISLKT